MPETVRILCPNCGRRLEPEPYRDEVTCRHCGQRSLIGSQPAGTASPHTAPPLNAAMPHGGGLTPGPAGPPSRSSLWIGLSLLGVLAAGLIVLFAVILPGMDSDEVDEGFFDNAAVIQRQLERELGFPLMVGRVIIYSNRADIDLEAGAGEEPRRITVRADRVLRRSGGSRDLRGFDIADLEFVQVPALVADARRVVGAPVAPVLRVSAERSAAGDVRWSVHLDTAAGVVTTEYDLDGKRLVAPEQPAEAEAAGDPGGETPAEP